MPTLRATAALLLTLAGLARGDGKVTLFPAEVEEGRPATLRVGWVHAGEACGLLALEASVGSLTVTLAPPRDTGALVIAPGEDEVVTVDVAPVGSAASPPGAGLRAEPCRVLRQVVPGETVALEVPLAPAGAGPLEVRVTARFVPLGGVPRWVRGATHVWSPPPGDMRLTLTRWLRPAFGPAEEVLVRTDALAGLAPAEERHLVRVPVVKRP